LKIKFAKRPPQRTSKLLDKPSDLKREHPALQKMKFINCFLFLWAVFALLDPDPDCESRSGYGSRDPIEFGSNPYPDPQHCRKRLLSFFHFTGKETGYGMAFNQSIPSRITKKEFKLF
jgi:hypothetical protein